MPKFSPLLPKRMPDKYEGLRSCTPAFKSGMQRVMNAKPNRNPITSRFIAEAVVPFPFIGPSRATLLPLAPGAGFHVRVAERLREIPTPEKHARASMTATWNAARED